MTQLLPISKLPNSIATSLEEQWDAAVEASPDYEAFIAEWREVAKSVPHPCPKGEPNIFAWMAANRPALDAYNARQEVLKQELLTKHGLETFPRDPLPYRGGTHTLELPKLLKLRQPDGSIRESQMVLICQGCNHLFVKGKGPLVKCCNDPGCKAKVKATEIEWASRKRRERREAVVATQQRPCDHCSQPFSFTRVSARFCSSRCRKAAHRSIRNGTATC